MRPVIYREALHKVLQRQGVIAAPHLHKRAKQAHAIEHHRQAEPRHANKDRGTPYAFRQRAWQAGVALARHRHEALFRGCFALQPEREQGKREQDQ